MLSCSDLVRLANLGYRTGWYSSLVFLLVDLPFTMDFDFAPLRKEVNDRYTDTMQTTGSLISTFLKLSAEFQKRHHAFERCDFAIFLGSQLFMNVDRNPTAVIETGDRAIIVCLLYTSPSPRDATLSRMPSSA